LLTVRIPIVIPGRGKSREPGIHIPEAGVHGFRASPLGRSRNDMDGHKSDDNGARLI
jgi:hypothetical protein